MSGLKSRFNDITLIKETLNIAFNEGNGAINVNSIGGTLNADISGQFVNTDISGQFVNIANFPENIIQGNNTVNNAAMNINATDNRLLVNSLVVGNTGNKLVINADGSINVSGTGGSSESTSYDLVLQGSTLWANSLPAGNPFVADLLGREGWWYTNQANVANKSNIYWYANPINGDPSGFQENDMTFSQLSTMYSVITCDFVDNGSLTIPTMGVFSQPTGSNDIAPGFAHSRWVYQLSSANLAKLRKGETILIYTGSTRPNVFNELPAYPLVQVSVVGEAQPTEIVGLMSINTQGTTSIIAYLLQYVGYINSSVGHIKQYGFKNSKERLAQENLAGLTIVDGVLSVSSSGGGGSSVIQGISTASGLAVDITATPSGEVNRLLVDSRIGDGTDILSVNNDGSINTISQVVAKDFENAESNMDIFARNNRLFTDTEITGAGNTLFINSDGSLPTKSLTLCRDADNAEASIEIFGKANRLLTNTEITGGGNTLVVNEDGSINVAGGGGQVQGIDTTSGLAVNINATENRLLTNSVLVNSTGLTISSTNTGAKECLDVAVISNSSVVRGYDAATSAAVDINATDNRLKTNSLLIGTTGIATEAPVLITAAGNLIVESKTHDGTNNPITSTVVSTKRGLDVNIIAGGGASGGDTPQGTFNNIHSGNLTAITFSTALNINNLYGNESVISYEDTATSLTSFISIHGSFDNVNYFYIGVLQPAPISSSVRQASAVLKLKGLKWIKILNVNPTSTATGVKATVFSG